MIQWLVSTDIDRAHGDGQALHALNGSAVSQVLLFLIW